LTGSPKVHLRLPGVPGVSMLSAFSCFLWHFSTFGIANEKIYQANGRVTTYFMFYVNHIALKNALRCLFYPKS
jgi:hypothetical protein